MKPPPFLRPEPPWLAILVAIESKACDFIADLPGESSGRIVSRVIRGQKARTTAALFDEFAAALQFPYYFGENWDAFDDCITDLAWLPGDAWVILVVQSIRLLEQEPAEQFQRLLKILEKAGQEWSEPAPRNSLRAPRAFHVLLQCTRKEEAALRAKLQAAKVPFSLLMTP